ncbi:MAG TPA: glycosyltransferase family 2 protein [Bryobacteraceae bacterium]|nr:glycosyltransferase family 2 protein [Bryobacteraceae bacterium]
MSCLDALAELAPEIGATVVDNASTDRTVELVRQRSGVRLVANHDNRGFAGAANQGFAVTSGDPILLLNPDVRLRTPLAPLVQACREHGLAAGQLTGPDGRAQAGFSIRRFPTPLTLAFELLGINRLWAGNPVNRRYRYLDRDLNLEGPVEQPAGAFLMTRRDAWDRLGGFDQDFHPVWFEDVDFCLRAAEAGYRIQYVPQVQAEHRGGHSVRKLPAARKEVYWYDSLLRYGAKHFRPWPYRGICLVAVLSTVPRTIAGIFREQNLNPVVSCVQIMRLAVRRLVSGVRPAQWSGRTEKL